MLLYSHFGTKLTTCSCHLLHCYTVSNSLSWPGRTSLLFLYYL